MEVLIAFILLAGAGICNAVMDKINFHYMRSIFKDKNAQFWSVKHSWRNKWKDGIEKRGPKFFGSTTFLVWTTDAWHLFQMIQGVLILTGFFIIGAYGYWWEAIMGYGIMRGVFQYFFKTVFEKR